MDERHRELAALHASLPSVTADDAKDHPQRERILPTSSIQAAQAIYQQVLLKVKQAHAKERAALEQKAKEREAALKDEGERALAAAAEEQRALRDEIADLRAKLVDSEVAREAALERLVKDKEYELYVQRRDLGFEWLGEKAKLEAELESLKDVILDQEEKLARSRDAEDEIDRMAKAHVEQLDRLTAMHSRAIEEANREILKTRYGPTQTSKIAVLLLEEKAFCREN